MFNKTQYKVVILISVFTFIIIFGLFQFRSSEQAKIDLLLVNGKNEKGLLIDKIVDSKSSGLKMFVYDYTYWDDMVSFIKTRDMHWAEENILSSLETYDAEAVWVFDKQMMLVYSENMSGQIDLPMNNDNVREILSKEQFPHFFIYTKKGLLEICAASVHPTSDKERVTPPSGYFFAGHLWTNKYLSEISELTQSSAKIIPYGEVDSAKNSADEAGTFAINNLKMLYGWDNMPVANVYFSSNLLIARTLKSQSDTQFEILIIFAGFITLLISLSIYFLVNRPLKIISSVLAHNRPITDSKFLSKKDEFGSMAKALNYSFEQKERLVNEISVRKKAEEELTEKDYFLSESQRVGRIGSYDIDFTSRTWKSSEVLDEIFGISHGSSSPLIKLIEIFPPEDKKEMMRYFFSNISRREIHFSKEFKINRANDRTLHWLLGIGKITFDAKGRPARMLGTVQDVSERKRYEAELVSAKEHAVRSDKLKDAFIANISHEIRTPLNGIIGMAELIKDSFSNRVSETEQKYFKAIDQSSSRLIKTVDMILNFSRVQVGDFPINKKKINLSTLIDNLRTLHLASATEKSLSLNFDDKSSNAFISADEYCITQAISNLIDNSIKYTESGGIALVLEGNTDDGFKLEIHDTGIGISEEYLPVMFEPYTQEQSGYNRSFEGVGLGLSLVKKYLALNGASISVKSKKKSGSTFTISFSKDAISELSGSIESPGLQLTDTRNEDSRNSAKTSILIVEDDSINRMYMETVLKGYKVSGVTNAAEAMKKLKSGRYDIILMDISLKGEMNGLELTKIIKGTKIFSGIYIIAVTGHTSPNDIQNCYKAGCDDYLPKPFTNQNLTEKIETAINPNRLIYA